MSDGIELSVSGVNELAAQLARASVESGARAYRLVRHHGMRLQAKVKANAQGSPGPRVQTGDYNRSIALEMGAFAGGPVARVGTNRPQARRLEFGFTGTDSRGRTYNQPPYPHFGPAIAEIEPEFMVDVLELAAQVMGR